jgi:hypothetical protein
MFLFVLNIYSIFVWIRRIGSYERRHEFIHSRLTRTSREEIPRFRLDFKYAKREAGDYVHAALVRAFITEYLEPDGFFFILILTINVSDFAVQEIIEQLWAKYVMKNGEGDAILAEQAYYGYRTQTSQSTTNSAGRSAMLDVFDEGSGATDSKRKYMKQRSDVGVGLLSSTSALEPMSSSNREQREHV